MDTSFHIVCTMDEIEKPRKYQWKPTCVCVASELAGLIAFLHSTDRLVHSTDRLVHSTDRLVHSTDRLVHTAIQVNGCVFDEVLSKLDYLAHINENS